KSLGEKIESNTNFSIKKFSEKVIDQELAHKWHKSTSPQIIIRNLRNGQVVRSERDIILLGDIRPGAVLRSTGSIIVIGNVQGTVHAGAKGDEEAIIVAPFLYDAQVRIGEHVEIIETDENIESTDQNEANHARHQVVFLNDLHVIEFGEVEDLSQIRPDFAKDLGGFEEWQKQL
ncbi:MAG TPA: septum site-determining protein MinC, partial [Atopostipes sp.]|nr:septum site-determining protein MinC [Atopostipes sp.]